MTTPTRHMFSPDLERQALEFQDECRDRLRGMMTSRGISQRELSRRTGLDSETIRRFLGGWKGTTLKTYAGLMAATGNKVILTLERSIEMAAARPPSNMSRMRDYALAHEQFTLQEAMKVSGLTKKQILGAISNLRHTGQAPLEIVTKGQAWRWSNDALSQISSNRRDVAEVGEMSAERGNITFELLATTKTGILVLQDEDGNLFKAERLSN